MSYNWKRNGWSDEEMVAANACRDKQWVLTKDWFHRHYTIYDVPKFEGVTIHNLVLMTGDLKEIYKQLNLEIKK